LPDQLELAPPFVVNIGGDFLGRSGKLPDHAAQFGLSIDGFELGRFRVFIAKIASGAWLRIIHAHELVFVFEHAGEVRPGKTTPTDYSFELPGKGPAPTRRNPSLIVLRHGQGRLAVLERWKGLTTSGDGVSVALAGLDEGGRMVGRYGLGNARPAKITAPRLDGKGNDIAIEEIVIDHEGLRVASSGAGRLRER
jgi:hypothetical protein